MGQVQGNLEGLQSEGPPPLREDCQQALASQQYRHQALHSAAHVCWASGQPVPTTTGRDEKAPIGGKRGSSSHTQVRGEKPLEGFGSGAWGEEVCYPSGKRS